MCLNPTTDHCWSSGQENFPTIKESKEENLVEC